MFRERLGAIAVLLLVAVLTSAARPSAAVDREARELWIYQANMSVYVGGFVVDVSGNMTYEFVGDRTISIPDLGSTHVNVITAVGELFGAMELFGEPFLDTHVTLDGYYYESVDDVGIVEENTSLVTDTAIGSGPDKMSMQSVVQTVLVYSPPYMHGFDPRAMTLGDSWSVTGNVNKTVETVNNGTIRGGSSYEYDYTVTIGLSIESVNTLAGRFDAIEVSIVGPSDHEIRWWSDEVKGFVKIDTYSDSGAGFELTRSLNLKDFTKGDTGVPLWVPLAGIAFGSFAVAVLAIVLMRGRHPKDS